MQQIYLILYKMIENNVTAITDWNDAQAANN